MIVGAVTVKTMATAKYTASNSKVWTSHDPLLSLRLFGIVLMLAFLQYVAGRHKYRRVAAAFLEATIWFNTGVEPNKLSA